MIAEHTAGTAAQELFERFGPEVYDHIYLVLGNAQDAEDITQDVFLRVLQSWEHYQHKASERTWLWSITRNCLREHYRKQRLEQNHRTPHYGDDRSIVFGSPAVPDSAIELHETLQNLTVPQRQVFVCRAVQGLSGKETAQLLGWSDVKVRVTLHRAIQRLQEVLQHEQGGRRAGG